MGALRELLDEAVVRFNAGAVEDLVAGYAEDAVERLPTGTFTGRQAIAERLRNHFAAFPDSHMEPHSWFEEGDRVVSEFEWTATHTGPMSLPGGTEVQPTGLPLTLSAVSVWRVVDGKCVEHRNYYDQLAVMTQLRLLPTPSA